MSGHPAAGAPSRNHQECGNCLRDDRLVMPVEYDCLGHRHTELECLACRLDFDRQAMARWHLTRVEGRHRRPAAWPLPCSWLRLAPRGPPPTR